jgi:ribosome maturation protein SDO1
MVTLDRAVIAHLDKAGKRFEVLVDPELALELKLGKSVSISRMLAINAIYTDAKKAEKASPAMLQKTFGTDDPEKIAEQIIREGEVQLPTELRRKKIEEKRRQIAALISRQAIDPRTRTPHPLERILNAMESAHVAVDPFKPAEQQVDEVLKAIKNILPISIEQLGLVIEVPAKYSSRVYGMVKEYGTYTDQWMGDKLVIKITIPAGLRERFYSQIGHITEGNVKISER